LLALRRSVAQEISSELVGPRQSRSIGAETQVFGDGVVFDGRVNISNSGQSTLFGATN